jgi:hypothetical protein
MRLIPFAIVASVLTFFTFCSSDNEDLNVVYKLPKSLDEVSGIEWVGNALFAIEDSGNENNLYRLNDQGEITNAINITDATNVDWEDLASDQEGNIYIGDFGNNDNLRKDLCIYKVGKEALASTTTIAAAKTSFSYPNQTAFPPIPSERFYDVEAFIVFQNHFYLFTKNRSTNSDGSVSLYKIPNQPGQQTATLVGKFTSCPDFNTCAITAATISPDQTKVAILSHDKIWLFEGFTNDKFYEGKKSKFPLHHYSQKEALSFINDSVLYIADEKVKKTGGKVYEFRLPSSK